MQLRGDVATRQAQVQVTNDSRRTIMIGDVRVEDPRFDGPRRVSSTASAPSVRAVASTSRCSCPPSRAPTATSATTATAAPEVVLEIGDEESAASVRTVADDPLGFIAPLHERECRAQALADAATLEFTGFDPSPAGEAATLELTVTPSGEGRATIVAVQATNLLGFGPESVDGAFPLDIEIDAGQAGTATEPIVVEVPIVPFRCDPHAVQEDKRGTIFDIRLALDGEPGEIELFVGEDLRGRILTWVADWCDFGPAERTPHSPRIGAAPENRRHGTDSHAHTDSRRAGASGQPA